MSPVFASGGRRGCVVLILDGLGDQPVEALGGRTPLEAASTPNLDSMASRGRIGLVDPLEEGVTPNTHSGVGMVFGLRPAQSGRLRRGPVEAAGAGLALRPGDIAFRANLATLEDRGGRLYVADRRSGRVTGDAAGFGKAIGEIDLGDGVTAVFRSTDQHRGALVFSGPGLSAELGDTDPGDAHAPGWLRPCRAMDEEAAFTAGKVDRFVAEAFRRLSTHPLNHERRKAGKPPVTGVITRGAGDWFEPDSELAAAGIEATLVAGCNTVSGLGRLLGLDTVREPGFTADAHTDIRGKLAAARAALERRPLAFVHIKAPDLFAHDLQPGGKRDFIERVDRELGVLRGSGAAVALTSDHTTDSNTGAHTADPVPSLFFDPVGSGKHETPVNFGEKACAAATVRRTGHEFLLEVVDYLSS